MIFAKLARAGALALAISMPAAGTAAAATVYDGGWNLTFFTRRGACDPSYNFVVRINNGIVSHANLGKFHGRVSSGGAVTASVSVPGKYASGFCSVNATTEKGRWAGHSNNARCSGTWAAQK